MNWLRNSARPTEELVDMEAQEDDRVRRTEPSLEE